MDRKFQTGKPCKELFDSKTVEIAVTDFSKLTRDRLKLLYSNYSVSQIAKLFGVSKSKVRYKLQKFNIIKRTIILNRFIDNLEHFKQLNSEAKERIIKIDNLTLISKALTHFAFRNGPVEDMHADGKFSNQDMMVLNKFMVNRLAYVFSLIVKEKWVEFEFLVNYIDGLYGSDWEEAKPDGGANKELLNMFIEENLKE